MNPNLIWAKDCEYIKGRLAYTSDIQVGYFTTKKTLNKINLVTGEIDSVANISGSDSPVVMSKDNKFLYIPREDNKVTKVNIHEGFKEEWSFDATGYSTVYQFNDNDLYIVYDSTINKVDIATGTLLQSGNTTIQEIYGFEMSSDGRFIYASGKNSSGNRSISKFSINTFTEIWRKDFPCKFNYTTERNLFRLVNDTHLFFSLYDLDSLCEMNISSDSIPEDVKYLSLHNPCDAIPSYDNRYLYVSSFSKFIYKVDITGDTPRIVWSFNNFRALIPDIRERVFATFHAVSEGGNVMFVHVDDNYTRKMCRISPELLEENAIKPENPENDDHVIELEEDNYRIEVSKRGYIKKDELVNLNEDKDITIKLTKEFRKLNVTISPNDSTLSIVDKMGVPLKNPEPEIAGENAVYKFDGVQQGDYSIEVSKPKFKTYRDNVKLEFDDATKVITLVNQPSRIVITTSPREANVRVINKDTKEDVSNKLGELSAGVYEVQVSHKGYISELDEIRLDGGDTVSKDYILKKGKYKLTLEVRDQITKELINNANVETRNDTSGAIVADLTSIEAGSYTVNVTKSGYRELNQKVEISEEDKLVVLYIREDSNRLTVNVDPSDATVVVKNDRNVTMTDLNKIPDGVYIVTASKDGYKESDPITVQINGSDKSVDIKLIKYKRFILSSNPPGASIIVKKGGSIISDLDHILDGVYDITVTLDGYYTIEEHTVEMKDVYEDYIKEYQLVSSMHTINVTTIPEGADVNIRTKGNTPIIGTRVNDGTYIVRCTKDGYAPTEKEVVVNKADANVSIELDKYRNIIVTTVPDGASIEIKNADDMVVSGNSFASGRYHITARKEGFSKAEADIELPAGNHPDYTLNLELDPLKELIVNATPAEVTMKLKNGSIELSPTVISPGKYSFNNLDNGAYTLSVSATDYKSQEIQIDIVGKNPIITQDVTLKSSLYRLDIVCDQPDATITVYKGSGRVPVSDLTKLREDDYYIVAEKIGYTRYEHPVLNIVEDTTVTITMDKQCNVRIVIKPDDATNKAIFALVGKNGKVNDYSYVDKGEYKLSITCDGYEAIDATLNITRDEIFEYNLRKLRKLNIDVVPRNSAIDLRRENKDGVMESISDYKTKATNGRYLLKITNEGYRPIVEEFEIRESDPDPINKPYIMEETLYSLNISTEPENCTVKITNSKGVEIHDPTKLTPDNYTVEVSKLGYETISKTYSVRVEDVSDLIVLGRAYKLIIKVNPSDAKIVVTKDGKVITDLTKVPAGTYTIRITKNGFKDIEETVDIVDSDREVSYNMEIKLNNVTLSVFPSTATIVVYDLATGNKVYPM